MQNPSYSFKSISYLTKFYSYDIIKCHEQKDINRSYSHVNAMLIFGINLYGIMHIFIILRHPSDAIKQIMNEQT